MSSNKRDSILYDVFAYDILRGYDGAHKTVISPDVVCKNTYVGIEVEVENVPNHIIPSGYWTSVEDGSLRNEGREFVSSPMKGQHIPTALLELETFLKKYNPHYDFSERTSIHVHVNVRDMTISQVYSFLLVYLVFEPVLYKFVFDQTFKDRYNSIFCVPLGCSGNALSLGGALEQYRNGKQGESIVNLSTGWKKYSGLNAIPLREKGTLEFRQMAGVLDIEKLVLWINLILCIKKYAETHFFQFTTDKILLLNTNSMYLSFLEEIFGEFSQTLRKYDLHSELEAGVISVKKALSFKFPARTNDYQKTMESFVGSSFEKFLKKKGVELNKEALEKKRIEKEKQTEERNLKYIALTKELEDARVSVNTLSRELDRLMTQRERARGPQNQATLDGRIRAAQSAVNRANDIVSQLMIKRDDLILSRGRTPAMRVEMGHINFGQAAAIGANRGN